MTNGPSVPLPDKPNSERLTEAAWLRLPVPLAWVLKIDGPASTVSLPDALGDSYLCANNPTYGAVRRAALELGYGFSAVETPLWRDYFAFPLTSLGRILAERTIPYFNTADSIRNLVRSNPSASIPAGFLAGNLRGNHAFHESAHCVASAVIGPASFSLEAIVAEAFANTCEWLGAAHQTKPLSDGLFYSLNSYRKPTSGLRDAVAAVRQQWGAEQTFTLLMLAFVEANLSTVEPGSETVNRVLATAPTPSDADSSAAALVRRAFELNMGFRDLTTPIWFELNGHKAEFDQLLAGGRLADPDVARYVLDSASRLWTRLQSNLAATVPDSR